MGNLLDWNALESRIKNYIDIEVGIDTRQKAFPILMVASILGISDEEASDAITDGAKDRGVDAVFVTEGSPTSIVHLFQFKCVQNFDGSKKNFPSGEIDKITSYISEMLDGGKNFKKTCNAILLNKTSEIWDALQGPVEFRVHFCGNMEKMTQEEQERLGDALQHYKRFTVQHYSLESIVKLFIDKSRPKVNRKISVVDKDYFERTDGNVRGLICTIEALEIVKMVADPNDPENILGDIFNDNVRVYLSKSNKINKKIIETALSEDQAHFWYLNNGITITCDSFSYMPSRRAPQIELENVQIVNGGQTTHALFEASLLKPDGLADVLVLVRIIETRSEHFSLAIAESTNSQTPIKGRDLRSNDDIQRKIEGAFQAMGYFYERKFNQFENEARSKRIDAVDCAQAYAAYCLNMPEIAKKDRGRIFGDLYESVFNDEVSVPALLASYLLIGNIDKLKKDVQKTVRAGNAEGPLKLFLIDGAFHVLYTVGLLCERKGVDPNDLKAASALIGSSVKIVGRLVDKEAKKDENFSFNRFFKDSKTRGLIKAAVRSTRN